MNKRSIIRFICLAALVCAPITGTSLAQDASDSQVDRLIAKLENENARVQRKAMSALGKMGPDARMAVPALIKLMRRDDHFRSLPARTLGKIGPEARQAVPALMDVLTGKLKPPAIVPTGPNGTVAPEDALIQRIFWDFDRLEAVRALGKIGPDARKAVPALIASLTDRYRDVRVFSALALGKIGPDARETVPALIKAIKDKNERVPRYAAAWALGKIGPDAKAAVPVLIDLLKDEDKDVRRHAVRALGGIGPGAKKALAALRLALKDEEKRVRKQAAKALRKIGDD